jgi:hypothetical protein
MSHPAIRAALETAIATITPAISTEYENTDFDPPSSAIPYQSVEIKPLPANNAVYGDTYREEGFMQVWLRYPRNVGTADVNARAMLVRDKFARGTSWSSGGVTTRILRTPSINEGFSDGSRWVVMVSIRYFADINP